MARSVEELRSAVLADCGHLVDFHVWPTENHISYLPWLANFPDDEQELALTLLSRFMFFSTALTDQLFVSAFMKISSFYTKGAGNFRAAMSSWQNFCDSVVVTYVEGEEPNPTDSGFSYARKARQKLGLPESSVMFPNEALSYAQSQQAPVLFVDDFVGSGNQFVETWERARPIVGSGTFSSFSDYASASPTASFYYCNAVTTQRGKKRIERECPRVTITSGNTLPDRYSVVRPDSFMWPAELAAQGPAFIERASRRAGIPDLSGDVGDWRGFHKFGLAIAFSDSVPDATIPLFYHHEEGWHPLVIKA